MAIVQSRRRFVTNAAVAGAAGLGGLGALSRGGGGISLAAEPPPEIPPSDWKNSRSPAWHRSTWPRNCCAPRALPISST